MNKEERGAEERDIYHIRDFFKKGCEKRVGYIRYWQVQQKLRDHAYEAVMMH